MIKPEKWIREAKVSYQSQRLDELLGGEDHHYNVWHEPTGIVLMYRKLPGDCLVYRGQLGVGPNFKVYYTDKQVDELSPHISELIEKRRNYMKPRKRSK